MMTNSEHEQNNEEVLTELAEQLLEEDILEPTAEEGQVVEEVEAEIVEETDPATHVQLQEANEKYLRLYAELENFRRRSRLDMEAAQKYRAQDLITNILPILDNFERAIGVEVETEEATAMKQGMEMIYNQLQAALKDEGVEVISALGEQFDPNFHQSIMLAEEPDVASNEVVEEFQKGYILKDRLIRPTMVKVNQ